MHDVLLSIQILLASIQSVLLSIQDLFLSLQRVTPLSIEYSRVHILISIGCIKIVDKLKLDPGDRICI